MDVCDNKYIHRSWNKKNTFQKRENNTINLCDSMLEYYEVILSFVRILKV